MEKRERVRGLFEAIAPRYDRLNRILSLSLDRRWRAGGARTLRLSPGDLVLDVCCGTGDFLAPLEGLGARTVGADFSPAMLGEAARKGHGRLVVADALALPFGDAAFDGATVGWGLRNVADLPLALAEIARVLKPGARFAALDMMLPSHPFLRGVSRFALGRVVPLVGAAVGRREEYAYLPDSILTFAPPGEIVAMMRAAGFAEAEAEPFLAQNLVLITGHKSTRV